MSGRGVLLEFFEVQLPNDASHIQNMHLSPVPTHLHSLRNLKPSQLWSPRSVVSSVVRAIRIPNLSTEPRTLKRHEHICQVTPVFEPKEEPPTSPCPTHHLLSPCHASQSASVQVDPDNLLTEPVRANVTSLFSEYDSVFDDHLPCYQAKVNMGHVEPP